MRIIRPHGLVSKRMRNATIYGGKENGTTLGINSSTRRHFDNGIDTDHIYCDIHGIDLHGGIL